MRGTAASRFACRRTPHYGCLGLPATLSMAPLLAVVSFIARVTILLHNSRILEDIL